jgi:hypothetical protein
MKKVNLKILQGKKGIAINLLLLMVLALVSFILIAILIQKFSSSLDEKDAEAVCRLSVEARTATAINAESGTFKVEEIKGLPLQCTTQDKVLIGTEEEIKKEIAEAVSNCWWMFLEGQTKSLFKNLPGFSSQQNGIVCYTLHIKEIEDKEETKRNYFTGQEFIQYLSEIPHPDMAPSKDQENPHNSYLDYVQYKGGPGRILMILNNKQDGLEGDLQKFVDFKGVDTGVFQEHHAYEIAYVEGTDRKSNAWLSKFLVGSGAGVGAIGAVTIAVASGPVGWGVGIIAVGVGLAGMAKGGTIAYDQLFKDAEINSIIIIDTANKESMKYFHDDIALRDSAGK